MGTMSKSLPCLGVCLDVCLEVGPHSRVVGGMILAKPSECTKSSR